VQLSLTIDGLRADVAALSELGDEATARLGERIASALGPAATMRLLDLLGQVALEISAQLESAHAELRVAGDDVSFVIVSEAEPEAPAGAGAGDGGDLSARLTLRLPEQLKLRVEEAADREGTSTNSWVVRVLGRAVTGGGSRGDEGIRIPGMPGRRLRGFGNS
jgi:hypothetical protein